MEPTNEFDVVVFTKPEKHGIATKRIKLVNGEVVSDATECQLWNGSARVEPVHGADGLAALINGLSSQEFIALGSIKEAFRPRPGKSIRVVSKDIYAALTDTTKAIRRARAFVEFPADVGAMLLDIDFKGMPAEAHNQFEAQGGPWKLLVSLFPALARAAHVRRNSTSSGLYHMKTGAKFPHSGGIHVYLIVADASHIPRATKAIFDTLWGKGFGWSFVSKGGAVLARAPIDASVGLPEPPVFEGPPAVAPPLAQESRRATAIGGEILDTRAAFPDPTAEIKQRAEQARAEWRARLKPEAEKVQKIQTEVRIKKAVAKAKVNNQPPPDRDRLRRELTRAYEEINLLSPDFELEFDDPAIGVATVAEVLSDRARFIDQTLADPLEGLGYGACKAMVMKDRFNGGLFIRSFAHGGMGYRLALNETMIRAMIEAAKPEDAVRVFLEAMDEAALFPGDEEALAALCAKQAGHPMTGPRALRLLRDRRNAQQEAKRQAKLAEDSRIVLKAPPRDGEVRKPALAIDAALANLNSLDAPVRNLNGRLAEIVKVPTPGLHLLTATDANSVGGERKPTEAPPEFTIREMTDARAGVVVEKHIRLEATLSDGKKRSVTLRDSWAKALNALHDESQLPIVSGIQTLPLVCDGANGSISIRKTNGIDRASGVMFIIDPEVAAALPDPETITRKDAERAYDRLINGWFGEGAASDDNKAVLVSLPLTVMQRLLLRDARPGYLITAPVAGAGKTTAAHMISEALFGRPAAAAWSSNPDSRRTALFSYLLAATPLVVWDNIARETALNCDYINAALTSSNVSDRMFHTQTVRSAAATTIQCFTGNAITAKGDMRSRVFKVALSVDREDPENRPFKRSDPLRWTRENRASILRDLYTILCWEPDVPAREKTRMKAWFRMIGHRLELLSGINFEAMISESGGTDPTCEGLATAVRMLEERFKRDVFYARDVASAMRQTPSDDDADADATPAPLKPTWTQDEVEQFQDGMRTAMDEKEETSRGRWQVDTSTSQRIGRRLQALANRPVVINRCTMTLRINPALAKRGAAFSIEIDV